MGLFKYYSFDKKSYSLSVVKNQQIYFNQYCNFNDPYDVVIGYNNDIEYYKKIFTGCENLLEKLNSEQMNRCMQLMSSHTYQKFGIFCCTESSNNSLMWSHYGNGHAGFCIEFTDDLDKRLCLENENIVYIRKDYIHYSKNRTCTNNGICAFDGYRKSIDWYYETETRITLFANDNEVFPRAIKFDMTAIKKIYIGCKTTLKDYYRLYKAVPKDIRNSNLFSFKLTSLDKFELVDYELSEEEFKKLNTIVSRYLNPKGLQALSLLLKLDDTKKLKKVMESLPISDIIALKDLFLKYSLDEIEDFALNNTTNTTTESVLFSQFYNHCILMPYKQLK